MMVDYEYSNLFQQSSVYKQLIIETDDKSVKITNNELHQQKFELEESLCSENQLNFGSCESSSIKFTVSNPILCLVFEYSGSGFPNPTIKYIVFPFFLYI